MPSAGPMSNQVKPLAGKVALITGAGRGIGRGIALELGIRGASIIVNYGRSASSAESVVKELEDLGTKAVALQADISKPAEVVALSSSAQMAGVPNHALYAGSKAAVEGFTRAFAVDCGKKRITCNAIAPGGIQSDMFDENSWHYVPGGYKGMSLDKIKEGLAKMCPLGRVGVPADIGKAVYCLVSDEGEWINGQVIRASGGGT
uniref:4HN reductase n=1 Tax=Daldinia eschscholtzii TaxID=292717 RepID=A0A6B7HLX6_9PEZI|nr:4HN reductase [Daldinia eschscholtzii]